MLLGSLDRLLIIDAIIEQSGERAEVKTADDDNLFYCFASCLLMKATLAYACLMSTDDIFKHFTALRKHRRQSCMKTIKRFCSPNEVFQLITQLMKQALSTLVSSAYLHGKHSPRRTDELLEATVKENSLCYTFYDASKHRSTLLKEGSATSRNRATFPSLKSFIRILNVGIIDLLSFPSRQNDKPSLNLCWELVLDYVMVHGRERRSFIQKMLGTHKSLIRAYHSSKEGGLRLRLTSLNDPLRKHFPGIIYISTGNKWREILIARLDFIFLFKVLWEQILLRQTSSLYTWMTMTHILKCCIVSTKLLSSDYSVSRLSIAKQSLC